MVPPMEKHRYFQFVGTKADKKRMIENLTYPIQTTYPKCDQQRYDDGIDLEVKLTTTERTTA
jgi:hypothetical protein